MVPMSMYLFPVMVTALLVMLTVVIVVFKVKLSTRTLQANVGESTFPELRCIRARRAGRSMGSFITPALLAHHQSIISPHGPPSTQV